MRLSFDSIPEITRFGERGQDILQVLLPEFTLGSILHSGDDRTSWFREDRYQNSDSELATLSWLPASDLNERPEYRSKTRNPRAGGCWLISRQCLLASGFLLLTRTKLA